MNNSRALACIFFLLLPAVSAAAGPPPAPPAFSVPAPSLPAPVTLDVWPGLAPGETSASPGDLSADASGRYGPIRKRANITRPEIEFYPAPGLPGRPKPTLLVCPGGGYYVVTTDIEGAEAARWLNTLGFNAAVLFYRVPDSAVPAPARREPAWQDAQRAMSRLRASSAALGIDPHRFGVLGFSAGGHLAARLACGGPRAYAAVDSADRQPFRPDFALLIYPAFLWNKSLDAPVPEAAPAAGMPPLFLRQTRDDDLLDADVYAAALRRQGDAADCRVYDSGGHGYGLRLAPPLPASHWPDEAAAWLRRQTAPAVKK